MVVGRIVNGNSFNDGATPTPTFISCDSIEYQYKLYANEWMVFYHQQYGVLYCMVYHGPSSLWWSTSESWTIMCHEHAIVSYINSFTLETWFWCCNAMKWLKSNEMKERFKRNEWK